MMPSIVAPAFNIRSGDRDKWIFVEFEDSLVYTEVEASQGYIVIPCLKTRREKKMRNVPKYFP